MFIKPETKSKFLPEVKEHTLEEKKKNKKLTEAFRNKLNFNYRNY